MTRTKRLKTDARLIETDKFPFEFLSRIGERESWRKEIHRPIYHIHKWWAKRLGSVFRGILLSCVLQEDDDLESAFYRQHCFDGMTVFDPFMGSGVTVGEAHKLGFAALGRDINPVAVGAVQVALGPVDRQKLESGFAELCRGAGEIIRRLYRAKDPRGRPCEVLYYFWVMQASCPECSLKVDLFSSYVIARNAYPDKKPAIQIVCPSCGKIFSGMNNQRSASCPCCGKRFDPASAPAKGARATCQHCSKTFTILKVLRGQRPAFRLYGKLVLNADGEKEYLPATRDDQSAYEECSHRLSEEVAKGRIVLPSLILERGYNTKQAMRYGFSSWRDFFNDRQLLALGYLRNAILEIADESTRDWLLTLFSGVLEFNNMFASYKGEGTGAVRHMFAHHVLKPERTPIEANVWGTSKSSGSFSSLFPRRLMRAIEYRQAPTEVNGREGKGVVCALPFTGIVERTWPVEGAFTDRGLYLSCGNSAQTGLPSRSVELIVTDPPFFDNVHYSELADFFFSWQQLTWNRGKPASTRNVAEVQDSKPQPFARKLQAVFRECHRVLTDEGLLVFTYHHARDEGWRAVADAMLEAGFIAVNSHPVKSEMSVAAPKSQAKEPIQFDMIIVCRKADNCGPVVGIGQAIESAREKLKRLGQAGFTLSRNDRKIVLFGQLLRTLESVDSFSVISRHVESELAAIELDEAPLFRAALQKSPA